VARLAGRRGATVEVSRFTIVVPVYNVRAYLRACLDSILAQSFADFEIIAVDDCSPDHSGEILDEYAASDPRVRVIHLPKNVGLGLAREAGIAEATGEYLLFVDSDDMMAVGALGVISRRLEATESPDILIFDYARRYWNKTLIRNKLDHLVKQVDPQVFTIDERPDLLTLLMVVWNKAFRREFIVAGGFHFPEGYYEDTPWTYPTLLDAKRVAILDRVCIHYRMRREAGNILKSRSRKHFAIFDQWDRVFAWLDEHPEHEHWRAFLLGREMQHVTTIMTNQRRLPTDARRAFFRRAHESYLRHKPPGPITLPSGPKRIRHRLLLRNNYNAFQAMQAAATLARLCVRAVGASKRLGIRAARRLGRSAKLAYYRFHTWLPVDQNLAVYSAYWERGVQCNPAAIYFKAREIAPEIRGVFVAKDIDPAMVRQGVAYARSGSFAYYRTLARAKFFINNVDYPDFVKKRRGTVFLQTQHGTPLKKMGLDLQDFPVGANRMSFSRLLRRVDRWDFNISSNRFSTEVWERSYPAGFETLEVGYPRNDRLVLATDAEREELRRSFDIPPDSRAVLFAPTFRDYSKQFDPMIDLAALAKSIGPGAILLMRCHYFLSDDPNSPLHRLAAAGRVRDVTQHPSVEDLAIASDALLTDYSSIMFDYAILDRPIALYLYDWDTYVLTRGINFDITAEPPGVVAKSADELLEAFRSGEVWGEQAAKARQEFRQRFARYDEGHAAEYVVRRILLGEALPAQLESVSTAVSADEHGDTDPDPDMDPAEPAGTAAADLDEQMGAQ
jgi:CDP-glycerol glycerophosphotransferase (TagB/SpsB family)